MSPTHLPLTAVGQEGRRGGDDNDDDDDDDGEVVIGKVGKEMREVGVVVQQRVS